MRKLIILAIFGFGAYKSYGYFMQPGVMAYDDNGNPQTLVFTFDGCRPCDEEMQLLKQRKINFTEYNVSANADNEKLLHRYGGKRRLPFTVSGDQAITGYQKEELIGSLAEVYGVAVLLRHEKRLLGKNFDANGAPVIVMYSTEKCGYCKQAIQYFNGKGVAYIERDINKDSAARRDYTALNGSGTPLIYVGYRRITGFDQKKLSIALELL